MCPHVRSASSCCDGEPRFDRLQLISSTMSALRPHVFTKDEGIKDYCAQPEVMAAWIHTVFDMYSDTTVRTPQMDMMREEFTNGADDKERFLELFQLTGSKDDLLTVGDIKREVSQARLAVTSRRYNRWI
jgi:hypothetical protein